MTNSLPHRHATSRIGLLGGSFNPAHDGHREISLKALSALELDAVWWLVSPGNPLKDKNTYAPYAERMAIARRVANHPRIVVSNFEERKNLQYTVDTIGALVELWPQMKFVWLMGGDNLKGFHLWRDWRKIASLTAIAVFARPGSEDAELESDAAQELSLFKVESEKAATILDEEPPVWTYIGTTNNTLSSTEIRKTWKTTPPKSES